MKFNLNINLNFNFNFNVNFKVNFNVNFNMSVTEDSDATLSSDDESYTTSDFDLPVSIVSRRNHRTAPRRNARKQEFLDTLVLTPHLQNLLIINDDFMDVLTFQEYYFHQEWGIRTIVAIRLDNPWCVIDMLANCPSLHTFIVICKDKINYHSIFAKFLAKFNGTFEVINSNEYPDVDLYTHKPLNLTPLLDYHNTSVWDPSVAKIRRANVISKYDIKTDSFKEHVKILNFC